MQTSTITKSAEGVVRRAAITQELAYYPYGGLRIDNQYGGHSQDRQFTGHIKDAETELLYMGSRYYPGSTGRFISQDPIALSLGDNARLDHVHNRSLETILKNPQRQNTYSYAGNNPVVNVDDNGEDYYYFNSGVVQQIGAGNRMFYESADQQMISQNASYMEGNRLNFSAFKSQVENKGPWDYKNNDAGRSHYFFDGQLMNAEDFGNAHYGYTGIAGGFGEEILKAGAGYAQIQDGTTRPDFALSYFDDPNDTDNILKGTQAYRANHSNMSTAMSSGMNTAVNVGSLGTAQTYSQLSSLVSSLRKLVKKLSE